MLQKIWGICDLLGTTLEPSSKLTVPENHEQQYGIAQSGIPQLPLSVVKESRPQGTYFINETKCCPAHNVHKFV